MDMAILDFVELFKEKAGTMRSFNQLACLLINDNNIDFDAFVAHEDAETIIFDSDKIVEYASSYVFKKKNYYLNLIISGDEVHFACSKSKANADKAIKKQVEIENEDIREVFFSL